MKSRNPKNYDTEVWSNILRIRRCRCLPDWDKDALLDAMDTYQVLLNERKADELPKNA